MKWLNKRLKRVVDEAVEARLGAAQFPAARRDVSFPLPNLDELGLSTRVQLCLGRGGIRSVAQLLDRTKEDLLAISNFGQIALGEVHVALGRLGLQLAASPPRRHQEPSWSEYESWREEAARARLQVEAFMSLVTTASEDELAAALKYLRTEAEHSLEAAQLHDQAVKARPDCGEPLLTED